MDDSRTNIWFGPGAEKGVFGAGVAHGLQESIESGELEPSRIRLYGSSIGCLNAAFLATGNAAGGLDIFREETRKLVAIANLIPATGARLVNRLARGMGRTDPPVRVPGVLNLDHVFDVMARRTPKIVDQLRCSPMPVFAETVDRRGAFHHAELGSADEPLQEIRNSLNLFPFTHTPESDLMDSVIKGYGFAELLCPGHGPLVIVLNSKPTSNSRRPLSDLACAAISADFHIAKLYLRRRNNRFYACQRALQAGNKVLVISPPQLVKLTDPSGFETAHALGIKAARRVVTFIKTSDTLAHVSDVSNNTVHRE